VRRVLLALALAVCASSIWTAYSWWPALVSLFGARADWIAPVELAAPLACSGAAWARARSERGSGATDLLRVLLVGLGLSWTCFILAVPVYRTLWLEFALGPALGITALVWWFEIRTARWRPGRAKIARALLVALALAPPLGEVTLRVLARVRPSQLLARDDSTPRSVLERNRRSHPSSRFGTSCNSGGHFDQEFQRRAPGETRVAMIGDSFSQGIVPFDKHYSTLAERALGFPIDNLGISGIGPLEYEELLVAEALPLDPSAVVISFFVGNDFVLQPEAPTVDPGLTAALDRRNLLVWLVPTRLASLLRERRANPKGIAGDAAEPTPQESALLFEERYPWIGHPEREPPMISKPGFLSIERTRANFVCNAKEEQLLRAVQVLERMHQECNGRPMGVVLIPDEFQVEDGLWTELALTGLERDRAQHLLVRELGRLGIPVLDLLPDFRAVAPLADGKRHLYHLQDTHWNTRGNAVAGEALTGFVRKLLASAPGAGR